MNLLMFFLLFLWNLSDSKGKFSCYAFIMNNNVLLYCIVVVLIIMKYL